MHLWFRVLSFGFGCLVWFTLFNVFRAEGFIVSGWLLGLICCTSCISGLWFYRFGLVGRIQGSLCIWGLGFYRSGLGMW